MVGPASIPVNSYVGISDDDLNNLTKGHSALVTKKLKSAAHRLNWALALNKNQRPWQQLFDEFNSADIVLREIQVIDPDGVQRAQPIAVPRGFGFIGAEKTLVSALEEFLDATNLAKLEACNPEELLSSGLSAKAKSLDQKNVSSAATARRKEQAAERHAELKLNVIRAINSMKSDPLKKSLSHLVKLIQDRWETNWAATHKGDQGDEIPTPPSRNTITAVLKSILPDHPKLKEKTVSHPGD